MSAPVRPWKETVQHGATPSHDAHDPLAVVARFDLDPESLRTIYKALADYDREFDRFAGAFPHAAVPLQAAKFAADRTFRTILGVLAEAKR